MANAILDGLERELVNRIEDGFDFLGQNVRRHGDKLLIKPSRQSVRALLSKLRGVFRDVGDHLTAGELIRRLKPILRGWTSYHRHTSSSRTFAKVDEVMFRRVWRWARRRHPNKSWRWVRARYFTRQDGRDWVFTGRVCDARGEYHTVHLFAAGQVRIRRHTKVRGEANPYDPAWEGYFEERLQRQIATTLAGRGQAHYLWLEQGGKCLVCGQPLLLEEGWQMLARVRGRRPD